MLVPRLHPVIAIGVAIAWGFNGFLSAQPPEPPTDALNVEVSSRPEDLEFFEKQIRPLLVEHCAECHGAEEQEAHLRLDSSEYWLAGGDSGPALVPGDAEASLLYQAIVYRGGDLEMPPTGKLPDAVIEKIRQWIERGAVAPQGTGAIVHRPAIDIDSGRQFWAYQPIRKPEIPDTDHTASSEIDRYLNRRLNDLGLTPNPEANRATLVRRLYLDLWGLPPTPEQIAAFVNDSRPDAYVQLVDELLASPRHGERWGRHWLDVARFGESLTLRGFVLPEAWRYRDYVIDAFNRDLPFDEFIRHQIAGDLIPCDALEERQRRMAATTFLALGNTNLEEQDKKQLDMDIVDEQLDTLGKAFLGQTIGCARCHDHKFDPIPSRDYYALAGILRNSRLLEHSNVSKWMEVPLPLPPSEETRYQEQETAVKELEDRMQQMKKRVATLEKDRRGADGKPLVLAPDELPGIVVDSDQAKRVGEWKESQFSNRYIGSGYLHDLDAEKGEKTLTFAPDLPRDGRYEVRLAYIPSENRADKVPITIFSGDGEIEVFVNQVEPPPIQGRFISLGTYKFEKSGQSYVLISTENTNGHVIADAVQFIPVDDNALPPAIAERTGPDPETERELDTMRQGMKQLEKEINQLKRSLPERPRVMTVVERPKCDDCPLHIRGSVHNQGEIVPRGFLQVASWKPPPEFSDQSSGRKELAEWLSAPENPLPARVYVNRVWHWLFGQGIVRTTDNFGATGEVPSHPELLDYLAAEFIDSGWSTRQLIRSMVLTDAYRRSSDEQTAGLAADPENRVLWRMPRKRLEAECIRDAMLLVSGALDLKAHGRSIPENVSSDFGFQHASNRRSVYLPITRNAMPEIFEVFDFADPSMVVGQRNVSTVAPQALFLMNHPFVQEQGKRAAERLLKQTESDPTVRLQRAFMECLGRPPTTDESTIAGKIVQIANSSEDETLKAWTNLYHVLFSSLDFRYRD